MWIQGNPEYNHPNYQAADQADLVVWCFPDENPHSNHVLPEAGEVAVKPVRKDGTLQYLLIVDLSRREVPADRNLKDALITAAQND